MDARSTLEQLLAPYTNPESHNAQRHRQTDGQQAAANSRSYCVAVRSAKNHYSSGLQFEVAYWPALAFGSAAQVAAAHCPNERT